MEKKSKILIFFVLIPLFLFIPIIIPSSVLSSEIMFLWSWFNSIFICFYPFVLLPITINNFKTKIGIKRYLLFSLLFVALFILDFLLTITFSAYFSIFFSLILIPIYHCVFIISQILYLNLKKQNILAVILFFGYFVLLMAFNMLDNDRIMFEPYMCLTIPFFYVSGLCFYIFLCNILLSKLPNKKSIFFFHIIIWALASTFYFFILSFPFLFTKILEFINLKAYYFVFLVLLFSIFLLLFFIQDKFKSLFSQYIPIILSGYILIYLYRSTLNSLYGKWFSDPFCFLYILFFASLFIQYLFIMGIDTENNK